MQNNALLCQIDTQTSVDIDDMMRRDTVEYYFMLIILKN